MKFILPILGLLFLISCSRNTSSEQQAVESAIQSIQQQASDSSFAALDLAIHQYIKAKGYTDAGTAQYLQQAAELSATHGKEQQALNYYAMALTHGDNSEKTGDLAFAAIQVIEKSNVPELNQIAYTSFANRFPQHPQLAAIQQKIEAPNMTADTILHRLGKKIFNDSTYRLNEHFARQYIQGCEIAAMIHPQLPTAPDHLNRAAETSGTLRDIPLALDLYQWIIDIYPTHPKAATSLFLIGFNYDNELKDFEKAGEYYHEYLSRYPTGEYAESAQFLLDNLGKTDEEWNKKIEEMSQKQVQ